MATGNLILGTARKKLGDVVMYRRGGKQVSRIRVIPKNPQSAKQAVQRMCLAESAKLTGALKKLVNHSFEGVPVGEKSLGYFRKVALSALRSAALVYFDGGTQTNVNFALKGSPAVGIINGLLISRGTLPQPPAYILSEDGINVQVSEDLQTLLESMSDYESFLKQVFNCSPGDQVTFIAYGHSGQAVASFVHDRGTEIDLADMYRYSRVTFKAAPEFDGPIDVSTYLPSEIVEDYEGVIPSLTKTDDNILIKLDDLVTPYDLAGYAVIISRKNADGTFSYSTSALKVNPDEIDENDADPTYLSYMKGQATVNVGDNLYLQNAELEPSSPNA